MACSIYNIESDKLFLCCNNIQVLEVYEIDNLYLTPVQQKHWTLVATLNFGEGREYKAMKIGDKEIIEGCDLQRLMRELSSLGMMVNREGLCFLKQEITSSSLQQCRVNYYRMFDQFDWSKYHVKVRVANTRWVCNDIVTGRPMLDGSMQMMFERESQLAETKNLHMAELVELKLKHIDDMKESKRKHFVELEQVKNTCCKKQKMEDKSEMKEDELLESNIHQCDLQVLIKALETLAEVVEFKRIRYPSQNVRLRCYVPFHRWETPSYAPDICIVISDMNALADSLSFPVFEYYGLDEPKFDQDNWWVVRVVRVRPLSKTTIIDTLIYYDGEYSNVVIPRAGSVPFPLQSTEFKCVSYGLFFYLAGVGVRYGFSVKNGSRKV